MHGNNRALVGLMYDHALTRKWVAKQLMVNQSTVDRWLQPRMKNKAKNPTYRHTPSMAIALLKYRLADTEIGPWDE